MGRARGDDPDGADDALDDLLDDDLDDEDALEDEDDDDDGVGAHEVIGAGADLSPGTLLAAYRTGIFPMGLGDDGAPPLGWWSPDPRGVLPLDGLRVTKSLARSRRRFEVRVDTAFAEVVEACADPSRSGRWITSEVADAYQHLHELGWAHSVEAWRDGVLVGGLYGVAVEGLFAGESMFSTVPDASKAALVGLVELLREDGDPRRLLDVQWRTDHLASLGVVDVAREDYLVLLARARSAPLPPFVRRAALAPAAAEPASGPPA